MSSLYEHFYSVGSVKSLITGKDSQRADELLCENSSSDLSYESNQNSDISFCYEEAVE